MYEELTYMYRINQDYTSQCALATCIYLVLFKQTFKAVIVEQVGQK